jgi:hypothetical protein
MYRNRYVRAFIPFGRKLTVSVLMPYLVAEHEAGVLDEVMLCLNTGPGQRDDERYAAELAATYPFVNVYGRPGLPSTPWPEWLPAEWADGIPSQWSQPRRPIQLNTGRFFVYMQDPDTIYLRFDDDIVWVHPAAIRRMVDYSLEQYRGPHDGGVLGVFPLILNNSVCSFHLQQAGVFPMSWGFVQTEHCMDPVGWASPTFAQHLHEMVLEKIASDETEDLYLPHDLHLGPKEQFSVSCFAVPGQEYADLGGVLDWDEEEHWLTIHRPTTTGRVNIVRGDALVSHYSFFNQRRWLLENTRVLDDYREFAETAHDRRLAWDRPRADA